MANEAELKPAEGGGTVPEGDGWFVLNAKDARWYYTDGRAAHCDLEGDTDFPQLGINVVVLGPGEPMAMYHWEADQEDFLVLSGEGLLIVEGEERPLRAWDLVHCPPETKHAIIGAGETRMRQMFMTGLSASIGLVPAAISTGIGAQVQQPLACVIVGGMFLSPICSLLIIPTLARIFMPDVPRTVAPLPPAALPEGV